MSRICQPSCLLALGLLLCTATASTAQVISIQPTVIDLGVMKQNEERETQVTITNEGAGRLLIGEIETDCGCTVPTLAKQELAPGASTVMGIVFDSKKFHGKQIKMIHVHSNDPNQRTVDIMIQAEVKTKLLIDPITQRVGFKRGKSAEDQTRRVTFTATEDPRLEIACEQTRKGDFELNVINGVDGDPQVSVLEVVLPGGAEPGKKRDGARVRTNIEGFETVDLTIQAWVTALLRHQPEEVKFRYRKEFNGRVRISPEEKGLEFKITGAECDLPEVQLEIDERMPNNETIVFLKGRPIARDDARAVATRGRIQGTLKIFTDLEELPEIVVPVSYMVRM